MIKVIKKDEYHTSMWSGGSTTEMFIYPEKSSYKNKDFLFRISSATVKEEKTVFTKLEGIKREIVLLEGDMSLAHDGVEKVLLMPYEPYIFEGGQNTTSKGKAIDFNLMYQGCRVSLEVINKDVMRTEPKVNDMHFFYSKDNDFEIENLNTNICVNSGDLVFMQGEKKRFEIKGRGKNQRIIYIRICV